jgi:hypothetical protein
VTVASNRRGVGVRPAWLTTAAIFLGLLFLMLPIVLALGATAVWAYYVCGLVAAVGIGLLAARWYRTTLVESGPYHRVIRVDALRAAQRAARGRATGDASEEAER